MEVIKRIQDLSGQSYKRKFNKRQQDWLPIIYKDVRAVLDKQLRYTLTLLRKVGVVATISNLTPSMFVDDYNQMLDKIWKKVTIDFATVTFEIIERKAVDPAFISDVHAAILIQLANRGANIANTTVETLETLLLVSVEEGLSIPEAATLLKLNFNRLSPSRATKIARTEIVGASNLGNFESVRNAGIQNDLVIRKKWLTAGDARVRSSHQRMGGEVQPIEERYSNGLGYPGDYMGGASEVINCRCVNTYIVED